MRYKWNFQKISISRDQDGITPVFMGYRDGGESIID
jgi:hypothetical protein